MTTFKRWCLIAGLLVMLSVNGLPTRFSVTPALASETVWTAITTGIEFAMMPASIEGKVRGEILVVRINPANAVFRVYYQPGQRKTVQRWAAQNPGAVVIVNTNFMRGNGKAVGLVKIGNDIFSAATKRAGSGQFEIKADMPVISVLAQPDNTSGLAQTPEPYMESFEGYPLLLLQGKQVYQPATGEKRSRRSIVAQDDQGRVLVIVTKPMALTLYEAISWLQDSGLGIVSALNLDGGSSSQVYLATDKISPLYKRGSVAVPVVLAIYPR